MRGKRFVIAGALLAVGMVAVVYAQPGGFGGGGGFGGSPVILVQNKAVQEDLKMTEDQAAKVSEWGKEWFPKQMEYYKEKGIEFGGFGGGKGGGKGGFGKIDPEMQAKMNDANAELNKMAYKDLSGILKDDQIKRLKQIQRQSMNIAAFTDPETVAALKLSDTQKTSVKGITGDFNKDRMAIIQEAGGGKGGGKGGFGGFGLDPETQKKITKLQKESVGKIVDSLDESQKKTWKDLTGEPFDLTKLQGGFGGKKGKTDK
jgi:hypothetical protein